MFEKIALKWNIPGGRFLSHHHSMQHPDTRGRQSISAARGTSAPAHTSFPYWAHGAKQPPAPAAAGTVAATAPAVRQQRRKTASSSWPWRRVTGWLILPIALYIGYHIIPWPGNGLHKPVGADFRLSGNFGELRPQHFHMGLDVRTDGKEDLPVYAVADGYVSRALIEEYGLGKALFVTHPNGTTTVYAHLNRFYEAVQTTVEAGQRKRQQKAVDQIFAAGQFPVKKGQRIALSGNTGGSEAPHLHFEVRDTRTGHNLNPLRNGFAMDDDTPPLLAALYWYNRQYSTYRMAANPISITGSDGAYQAARPVIKVRSPLISLGMRATDKNNDTRFRLGVYRTVTEMDGKVVHESTLDDMAPDDSRYINACVDYPRWVRTGSFVQHLATLPGNELPAWKGKGLLDLSDGRVHAIRIRLYDVNGNSSQFESQVQYSGATEAPPAKAPGAVTIVPGKARTVSGPSVKVNFPVNAFYDTVAFAFTTKPAAPQAVSEAIALHTAAIPVHDSYTVSLRAARTLTAAQRRQVVMQLNTGKKKNVVKGQWKEDWLTAAFKELGTVQLLHDQRPPTVAAAGWEEGQTFSGDDLSLKLICLDDMGSIASFRATLNGQWLLYDSKGKDFTVHIPANCPAGKQQLVIAATDIAGNTTTKTIAFRKAR